jgi:hypothetical protein
LAAEDERARFLQVTEVIIPTQVFQQRQRIVSDAANDRTALDQR